MNFEVFISYSHQDKATADAACAMLEADGIRCWIAPRDVVPGAEWAATIVDAIDRCRVMVLIFSSSANQSRQIHREVQQAFDREVPVVPLRMENVAPTQSLAYYMGPVHWLDALTPPLETHLKHLRIAVKAFLQAKSPGDHQAIDEPQKQIFGKDRQWSAKQRSISASRLGFRWLLGAGAGAVAAAAGVAWLVSSARVSVTLPTPSTPRPAMAIEGAFKGTMQCDKLPWTAAPLHAAVSLSIQAGKATFSRDVYSSDGKRKTGIETGTGALDSDGTLELTTSWVSQTSRFDGSYVGRLSTAGGSLAGKQILSVDGTRHERSCTIIVQKVGDS